MTTYLTYRNYEAIQYFPLENKELFIKMTNETNNQFVQACLDGDLNTIKTLFQSPIKPDIHIREEVGLASAAAKDHLHVVEFLLDSPELSDHANFSIGGERALNWASNNANIDIITYFVSKYSLDEDSVYSALRRGSDDTIKYILSAGNIHCSFNIHKNNSALFINYYKQNREDLIHYLIFDYGISLSPGIRSYMKTVPELAEMFRVRKLKEKLDIHLTEKHPSFVTKKNKI